MGKIIIFAVIFAFVALLCITIYMCFARKEEKRQTRTFTFNGGSGGRTNNINSNR